MSRDKEGVERLSTEGQIIEKPEDLLKDPYVLEFTGLPELAKYYKDENGEKYESIHQVKNQAAKIVKIFNRKDLISRFEGL